MRIIKKVLILAVILTPTFFFIQCQNGERSEQEALSASAKEGKNWQKRSVSVAMIHKRPWMRV